MRVIPGHTRVVGVGNSRRRAPATPTQPRPPATRASEIPRTYHRPCGRSSLENTISSPAELIKHRPKPGDFDLLRKSCLRSSDRVGGSRRRCREASQIGSRTTHTEIDISWLPSMPCQRSAGPPRRSFSRHLGADCGLAGPGCSAQGAQLHPLLHLQLDLYPGCAAYRLPGTRPHSAGVLVRARP
jgi:hypothetical protein